MENRRTFIKKCAAGCAAAVLPVWPGCLQTGGAQATLKTRTPKRALVLWYSQTGHTERVGRVVGHAWEQAGLAVDTFEYRAFDPAALDRYDMIVVGSPVHYMDVPRNLHSWLEGIPRIEGTPVGAFVTFGGAGDGQQYTARALLALLAEKGGVPVGSGMFANMSTFAPTWSLGNAARILTYRHLPNEDTYRQARVFARELLGRVQSGQTYAAAGEFGLDAVMRLLPQIGLTKMLITRHGIDGDRCIGCGVCVEKCPTGAIHPDEARVDTDLCIACMGCINNCPVEAVEMHFMGRPVYGFPAFLKRNGICIDEPVV